MSGDSFKERLVRFARVRYNKGQNKFEEYCGINRGTINNITKGISTTTLKPIAEKCPELNLRWLVTGEGEMCLDEELLNPKNDPEMAQKLEAMEKQIADLQATIYQQQDVIRSLTTYVSLQTQAKNG